MEETRDNAQLCYISGEHDYDKEGGNEWIAFFTTQSLNMQWGDDWNDAPYECNAGWPYLPNKWFSAYDRENKAWYEGSDYVDGVPKWRIHMVTFSTENYLLPCAYSVRQHHDRLSVQEVNEKEAAWLWPAKYDYMDAIRTLMEGEKLDPEPIFAGETLKGFCEKMERHGKVLKVEEYEPRE